MLSEGEGFTLPTHQRDTLWTPLRKHRKQSRNMKTGIKFRPCNVGACEAHNTRNSEYCAAVENKYGRTYFFNEYRHLNQSWVNPAYRGVTLPDLFEQMKVEVKEKTGRAMQTKERIRKDPKTGKEKVIAGASPIREGVAPIKPETKIDDFRPFVEWLQGKGVNVIRIDIHRDEGHVEFGEFYCNNHVHIVADFLDHQTGKSVKLNADDCRTMQTLLAGYLDMERGVPKELTGIEGQTAQDFKIQAQEKRHTELKETNDSLQNQIAEANEVLTLKNKTLAKLGLRTKSDLEKENESLKTQLQTEKDGRAADKTAADLEKSNAVAAVRTAASEAQKKAVAAATQKNAAYKAIVDSLTAMPTDEAFKKSAEDMRKILEQHRAKGDPLVPISYHREVYGFVGGDIDHKVKREVFEPLCESMGCHQVPKQDFAVGRRIGVAQRLVIASIRFFNSINLDQIAKALTSMAQDFNLERYNKAKADADQRRQQQQNQEEKNTPRWGHGR